jgi:type I restriction enzyme S subunit
MAGDWVEKTIGEAPIYIGDGNYSSKYPKSSDFVPEGVPFITASDMICGHIRADNFRYIGKRQHEELKKGHLCKGDVIVVTRGNGIGNVAFVDPEYHDANINAQLVLLRADEKELHNRFLYFLLSSKEFNEVLIRYGSGSAQPQIPINSLIKVPLRYPAYDEQRAIAHILGTLDDKIELNRRTNETLEAMARALFKSWFVDFEPVHAKADGRDTGLPKGLADLFPDSFEDSELGEIPKGWAIKSVGDLADVVGGTTPSTKESAFWESGTHAWATPKDLSGLSVPVLLDTERRITDAGLLQIGSGLLPAGTVLLSSRAPIGYLAIAELPVAINQGFIAMTSKVGTSNLFLLLWASVAHEEIVSRANGSTFLEISKTNFRPISVVTPSADIMQRFDELAKPLYERIVECARESRTLAALRDALLPKLISGELRVKAADDFVQEATV